jgi:hypothetical protein
MRRGAPRGRIEVTRGSGRRAAATALALACASACADVTYDDTPHGNPPGYRVHSLSADYLTARQAAINGISLDTSSAAAIAASVDAILRSGDAPRTVEESPVASADLAVDFTAPARALPELFYGADLQWFSRSFLTNPKYRELVRHLRLDVLRFPGGQERVRYDRHARSSPDDALGLDQPYQFVLTGEDVANYVAFCRELGIAAEPELDLYLDDPAMWASLVDQIVNELGYDLRYVSVGNEPEVNNHASWTYLNATSKQEAIASYMARYLRYHTAVERVKPGLRYALAETGEWNGDLGATLDEFLSRLAGDQPGALSVHWYMLGDWGQSPSEPDFPSLEHLVVRNNAHHEISYLATVASAVRAAAQRRHLEPPRLFLGEWGPAWSATYATSQIQDRMASAIFVAEVNEFCKTLGFDSLEYFSLSDPASFAPWNPALISVDGDAVTIRPQYYVYLIYKYLYGDEVVTVADGQNDDWSLYAAKDAERSYLMLLNRTAGTTITKTVEVRTAAGTRLLRLTFQPHSVSVVSF